MECLKIDFGDMPVPIAMRFETRISDEEFMLFSERNRPYRFERDRSGEIKIMTPVGGDGGEHEVYVSSMLFLWTQQAGTGKTFSPNTGFNLPDGSCLAPDACWVAIDRVRSLTPAQRKGYPPLCPEFVIEIRSQSDPRRALEDKMALWMQNGAKLAWLIDPIDRTVTVYRAGEPTELLEAPEVVRGHAPVAGFELQMNPIWNLE